MQNGLLDPSTLVVLPGFQPYPARTNFLPASSTTLSNLGTPAMAQDLANMATAFRSAFGQVLTYAEAYRSLGMQQQRKREQGAGGPLAAEPGYSNHGWAQAMDFRNDVGTYSSAQHEWFVANAKKFGFTPIPSEGWHWEHLSDSPVTAKLSTASTSTTVLEEATAMPFIAKAVGAVADKSLGQIAGRVFRVTSEPFVDTAGVLQRGEIRWIKSPDELQQLEKLEAFPVHSMSSTSIWNHVKNLGYSRSGTW